MLLVADISYIFDFDPQFPDLFVYQVTVSWIKRPTYPCRLKQSLIRPDMSGGRYMNRNPVISPKRLAAGKCLQYGLEKLKILKKSAAALEKTRIFSSNPR